MFYSNGQPILHILTMYITYIEVNDGRKSAIFLFDQVHNHHHNISIAPTILI